ncbi:hypothetical protein GGI25_003177 [Coemansia spiralis]|uniref:TLC domain-containing protein n=2 Tax=Coemansia TaxID=4863 RepID=A0A9W8G917_9FUNG|nr:hypothetical protein EDC05_003171 [Coemansia umbellata]KAJ2621867.1 hypothetical protein GGI26_003710 [Coemansia sp. RSA 1358]KAJ2677422.1 hypothetical protein GGI25_003177 [Coemansia spiralis]
MSFLVEYYQQLVDLPAAQRFCSLVGLPKLTSYWPTLLALSVLCQLLRLSSNTLSSLIFGAKFNSLSARQKYDWGVRLVSQVHAVTVVVLAVPIFFKEELIKDKLYGFDNYTAWVYTILCGYFLWDIFVCISDHKKIGIGFTIHAIASFGVFILIYRPSLQYHGASFIMFEASTIFLNNNWWLDKLGMTGSRLQLYNASILVFLYLTVRLMFGTYMSYHLFEELKAKGANTPTVLYYFYRIANHAVMILSYYWFYLMIIAIKKRFVPKKSSTIKTKAD